MRKSEFAQVLSEAGIEPGPCAMAAFDLHGPLVALECVLRGLSAENRPEAARHIAGAMEAVDGGLADAGVAVRGFAARWGGAWRKPPPRRHYG